MRERLPPLLAVAQRILGDRAEAEDVAQEVFLRTWKQAESWEPGKARISTWMHRVCVNLCLDRLRRRREHPAGDQMPEPEDERLNAAQMVQAASVSDRVRAAMMSLPERQRAALALSHFEQLSNPETAEILGLSVEAVESLLSRARRRLRELLSDERRDLMGDVGYG